MSFFKIKKVDKKFSPSFEKDRKIDIPHIYRGMLSGLTEVGADALIQKNSNLIQLKKPKPDPLDEKNISKPQKGKKEKKEGKKEK